ncbi:px serine/threonine kinase pxk [Holotrichia oblita]|uniref:Px serine/threonine kinase pxk n=1 Tax=Holotrichia oblita TaxID=644536 RepID=A0ACB9TK74_HOLOL|nr:px serine/threonine kinase pxk [Holotrichia oblita]
MAIFEKQASNKVLIDDTESISCVIENWFNTNGHTEFVIRVQRGPFSDRTWRIHKRYNDFVKLHSQLQASGLPLTLPPKKIIGNMDPEFISERQQALQKYLNTIVMNPILVSSLPARSFIDPANYCQPFRELALQHVSLALRGEVGWEVVSPLTEIGWRLRKHYYHVRSKNAPKEELWASWIDYGPDRHLDDKDMHAVFKSLSQIQHPYIYPIELCLCTDIGALVVRTSHKNGSLRDIICGVKPKQSFLKKYGNPKGHKPLEISQIALYGRQILEVLKFLHDKALPYGHLHTGNIIIDNDRVKLLDIENGVLGVPSFYRPYFMQHKKIFSMQSIDVYCFGHTLYEMTFGAPLHESIVDSYPADCQQLLKSVLDSILSPEACKAGLPTIEDLLHHPFFSTIVLTLQPSDRAHLKIPNSTKEQLKKVTSLLEERLKEEQKMVRSQKRLVRVQEMMSSEEERKKQRSKLKQEQKMAKEKQRQKTLEEKDEKDKINGITNGDRAESVNSSSTTGTATPPSITGGTIILLIWPTKINICS